MAEFFQGTKLNSVLEDIFENAEKNLILISPFIKLHPRFKDILNLRKEDYNLKIQIVFGKNEGKEYKSLGEEEFNYLKTFPNIEIRYNERLHAKYYANQEHALLSSMNLYDYSQNNNIEFGILTETSTLIGDFAQSLLGIGNSIDEDAFQYFNNVLEQSPLKFLRTPMFENKNLGLTKKFIGSETEIDSLTDIFKTKNSSKKLVDNPSKYGYCIRTGEKIPFNPKQPMSKKAWKIWKEYANDTFPEKFCHKTGKSSEGKTSMKNPILP
ncbi:phospholipase D family protein [Maribacter sp. MAR_2009_72]|uniref:phospholipase D family protein n=1 Tax=Maribacter sp. MAR_2009_72 TaxID=1250050 RepID=UPI001198F791|nr:phospholipase D family protein [Maribacter sp. MAR_2009_72]TVZ16093.1 phospholipase D-like protein [Maribacter sp. MAR_2009_72]